MSIWKARGIPVKQNVGTWGLSALSKMLTSGVDFEKLSNDEKRTLNNLPAMIYHGVNTEPAVLMRINSVPRSIATNLGERFASMEGNKEDRRNVRKHYCKIATAIKETIGIQEKIDKIFGEAEKEIIEF